jgi:spore coat protein JB
LVKSSTKQQPDLLRELQAIDFALTELTLYLDTHPDDKKAIEQHKELVEQCAKVRSQLETQVGALNSFGTNKDQDNWQWSEAPWPWQI